MSLQVRTALSDLRETIVPKACDTVDDSLDDISPARPYVQNTQELRCYSMQILV